VLDIKRIYKKNIFRMLTAFLIWSCVYAVYVTIAIYFEGGEETLLGFAKRIIVGHYHMWFIPLIIGLYVMIPILKRIAEDEKLLRYTLLISGMSTFVIPQFLRCINSYEISKTFNYITYQMPANYIFYFLCGYYLSIVDIKRLAEYIIYILGSIGLTATIVISYYNVQYRGATYGYYDNFNINILLICISIFVFFRMVVSKVTMSERTMRLISIMSNCCCIRF